MIKLRTLCFSLTILLAILTLVSAQSLPSQIPTTVNKYELRRPLRFSYLRLISKLELNPIIGHLATQKKFCSSKLGPHCMPINSQLLQEYQLMEETLTDVEKNAYLMQKYYQPARFQLSVEIEKKTSGFFLVPSNEYKIIDAVVKRSVKSQMHEETTKFYVSQNKRKENKKGGEQK